MFLLAALAALPLALGAPAALVDRLVDVNGTSLLLRCGGERQPGAPLVLFEAGAFNTVDTWRDVHAPVAALARACAWDRPGRGASGPAPAGLDASGLVELLRGLLQAGGEAPPYLLVGHSLGGLIAQLHVTLHPGEVAGLVLVDSSHRDQVRRMAALKLRPPQVMASRPSPEAVSLERLMSALAEQRFTFAGPLVVLTRGRWTPGTDTADDRKRLGVWQELQRDLASASARSEHHVAANSGHYIQNDEPELVVRAVRRVLDLVSAGDAAAAASAVHQASAAHRVRGGLCGSEDRAPAEVARLLEPLGEQGRTALIALAESPDAAEVLCGVAGLAALRDRRVIPYLEAALRNPELRGSSRLLARWAAWLAGGPDPDLGAAMLKVVEAATDSAVWNAAGLDAIWLLGEVDHPSARDRLLAELGQPIDDARLDAVVHALARQGDPRARERITAIGVQAARDKSGNATPEQARRLGAVAFYQLALGPETLADGLETLGTIAARDQEDAAAWAVHTLCERAVRRPDGRTIVDAHRAVLVEELDRLGISWQAPAGTFGCR